MSTGPITMTSQQASYLAHQRSRLVNALSMFRPAPHQEEFFRTFAKDDVVQIMLGGGNRCLAGCQEVYDPVAKVSRPVSEIGAEFHVESRDPATGLAVVAKASAPYIKGHDDFYTVRFTNGQSIVVTLGHLMLSASGVFVDVSTLREVSGVPLASTEEPFLCGFRPDADRCSRTVPSFQCDCLACRRSCGEPLPLEAGGAPSGSPLQAGVQEHADCACGSWGDCRSTLRRSRPCSLSDHLSTLDEEAHHADQYAECEIRGALRPCSPAFAFQGAEPSERDDRLSAASSALQLRTSGAYPLQATQNEMPFISPKMVFVASVEYHSTGAVWDFEVPSVKNYCLGGVVHHNSGKSLSAAASMASFILDQPITFRDGSKLHMRPRRWAGEATKIWCVGYDWDHTSSTLYRLLFKEDAFRIIRDESTKKWRAWNPDNPGETIEKTRAAPPFLPMEEISGGEKGISWENKKENQISSVTFKHDGTRVEFYPSTGARPQGDPCHLIWIDEHIHDESWYSELLARLIDYRGRLFWTAWADTAPSSAIMEARELAAKEDGLPDQRSYAFTFRGGDNPFTKSKHRDYIMATFDEETRAARDWGEITGDRWKVYPKFGKYMHRLMGENSSEDDALASAVRNNGNQIPADWTRYMILDPGTSHAALLWVAVPPPRLGDYIVPYEEFYVPKTSAAPLAEAAYLRNKDYTIEDIIADPHACRQTPMGFSKTVGQNYEEAFAKAGVTCRRHGSRLSYGSDDVDSRIMRLQTCMNIRGDGTTRLRIMGCHQLVRQLERARWGSDPKGQPIHKPAKYQKIDLVQALEYFVSREDCVYFKPPEAATGAKDTRAEVMQSIAKALGKTIKPQVADRSVFCGAGEAPSY